MPRTLESLITESKQLAATGKITAPVNYLASETKDLINVVNGCGSALAKYDFIPDTIYGAYIGWVCFIHDFEYYDGQNIEDKEAADRRMLNNLLRLINNVKGWRKYIKPLMRRRALKYYEAVNRFGGPAFWDNKT